MTFIELKMQDGSRFSVAVETIIRFYELTDIESEHQGGDKTLLIIKNNESNNIDEIYCMNSYFDVKKKIEGAI